MSLSTCWRFEHSSGHVIPNGVEGSEIFQQVILRMPLGEPSAGHLCFTKETTSQGSQEQRSRILITHAGLGNNHLGSQCLPQGGWSSEFEQDLKQFWLTRLQLSGYCRAFCGQDRCISSQQPATPATTIGRVPGLWVSCSCWMRCSIGRLRNRCVPTGAMSTRISPSACGLSQLILARHRMLRYAECQDLIGPKAGQQQSS